MTRLCKQCNKPIPAERLEALPEAICCVTCQSQVEKAAQLPKDYSGEFCPQCEAPLVWRRSRGKEDRSEFLGCSRYPACDYTTNWRLLAPKLNQPKAIEKQVRFLVSLGVDGQRAKSMAKGGSRTENF